MMQTSFNTPAPQPIIELYMEFDAISWYYKFLAGIANWSTLAGFMIFPNAFDNGGDNFRIGAGSLRAVAVCLLVFGYLLAGLLCWRFKNLLFQVEAIFLPGFTISTIGFMSSLFNVYGRKYVKPEDQWSASAITSTVLSSVSIVLYGAASLHANRMLNRVRGYRKELVESQEDESLLTEEERTRRNLLSLLLSPQQQQEEIHKTGGLTYSPAFEHTSTPSTRPFSRAHRSRAYPSSPPMPGSSYSNTTYQMSNYPMSPPLPRPSTPGTSQSNRECLAPTSSFEPTGTWGISGSALSDGAPASTFVPSRKPLPQTPSQNSTSYTPGVTNMDLPDNGRSRDFEEKEVIRGPPRRKSIFAGISATVGHGKERVGAGWASWSRS